MNKTDYIILLLLLVVPPAAFNLQSYVKEADEIILSLQNTQIRQNDYSAKVFGEIKNNRPSHMVFITARYRKNENETVKLYPTGLVKNTTVLEPGESLKTDLRVSTGSFKPENIEIVFNETDAVEKEQAEYNIENFSLETPEADCKNSTAKTCYRPVIKVTMTNTGDKIIYSPRFSVWLYDEKGPVDSIQFKVTTGERLDKWHPGKTLDLTIEHDRVIEYKPVRYEYKLNYL